MAILFSCECGRRLRTDDARGGTMARCPSCGATLAVPAPCLIAPPPLGNAGRTDSSKESVNDVSQPPKLRTPGFVLYLGILSGVAIFWGAFATSRLQVRARQLEESLQQATLNREKTQAALRERTEIEDRLKSDKERVEEQLKAAMKELTEIKTREEEKLHAAEHLPRINDGENHVNQEYVESFGMNDREIRFVFSNKTSESLKPTFDLLLVNKAGHITATVNINWTEDSIKPGDTRVCFEILPAFRSGVPVAYSIRFVK
jgi:hypothetical protein